MHSLTHTLLLPFLYYILSIFLYILPVFLVMPLKRIMVMEYRCSQSNHRNQISRRPPEEILMIQHTDILIPTYTSDLIRPCHVQIRNFPHYKMIAVNLCHMRNK